MADVTIMGAGIFGLSVAWCCQSRGAQVQVIDPGGPGAGASGGIVGALAPHVPENWNDKKAFQLESLLLAQGFWAEVEAVSGMSSGYGRLGRLQPLADQAAVDLALARAEGAKALWHPHATWDVVEASAHHWAPVTPTGLLIHDTLSARLHPRHACASLAAALTSRGGAVVREGTASGYVVWATGVADLDRMSAHHTRQVGNGVKGQGALLRFDTQDLPQLFAEGVYIVPHGDGTVAIGSTSERDYTDATSTDAALDAVIEKAMLAVPILHGAPVIERWAALRPRTRSRAPMLGKHPLHKGQFIANGGFKIGFGMAPKVGQVMADLILEDHDTIPKGFMPDASF
jgi:glycine oxidase